MSSKTFYECGCMEQGDQFFHCNKHTRPAEARAPEPPPQFRDRLDATALQQAEAQLATLRKALEQVEARFRTLAEYWPEDATRSAIYTVCADEVRAALRGQPAEEP